MVSRWFTLVLGGHQSAKSLERVGTMGERKLTAASTVEPNACVEAHKDHGTMARMTYSAFDRLRLMQEIMIVSNALVMGDPNVADFEARAAARRALMLPPGELEEHLVEMIKAGAVYSATGVKLLSRVTDGDLEKWTRAMSMVIADQDIYEDPEE